ncbi:MAG: S-adenosylmethionine decarboxylase [Syntrophorhabdaceae bacterium]
MGEEKRQGLINSGELLGVELILDIHNCNIERFGKENLEKFVYNLCNHIGMDAVQIHTWEYLEDSNKRTEDFLHLKGHSVVLFLKTSNITLHSFDNLGKISLNIYSCKDFDEKLAEEFCLDYFQGEVKQSHFMLRY